MKRKSPKTPSKRKAPKPVDDPEEDAEEIASDSEEAENAAMDCNDDKHDDSNSRENEAANSADAEADVDAAEPEKRERKKKHGIIYLSTIPKHMTVAIARKLFSQFAAVGRMFFQPVSGSDDQNKNASTASAASSKKKKKSRFQPLHFGEGWVEFLSKRAAKAVAQRLNGQPIALRKSSKFADILWSIKYLPRFKWVHLSERLTYEKAVHKQRLHAEVSQARREAQFFQENLDRSDKNKRLQRKKAKVAAAIAAK